MWERTNSNSFCHEHCKIEEGIFSAKTVRVESKHFWNHPWYSICQEGGKNSSELDTINIEVTVYNLILKLSIKNISTDQICRNMNINAQCQYLKWNIPWERNLSICSNNFHPLKSTPISWTRSSKWLQLTSKYRFQRKLQFSVNLSQSRS